MVTVMALGSKNRTRLDFQTLFLPHFHILANNVLLSHGSAHFRKVEITLLCPCLLTRTEHTDVKWLAHVHCVRQQQEQVNIVPDSKLDYPVCYM